MPRLTNRVPRLCCHKATGRAVVYLNGRDVYLGAYGSSEAKLAYDQIIAKLNAGQPPAAPARVAPSGPTINQAVLMFWAWALERYRDADGKPTGEHENFREPLRVLRRLFGRTMVAEFGPNKLRLYRDDLVARKLARTSINHRVSRIRQLFRWCVGRELCPVSVYESLRHVEPLREGQGGRETPGRGPVTWSTVEATLPHLSPLLQALVRVLWHTGARCGEIRTLATSMIDRSGEVWCADLRRHKNAYRGQRRVLLFGPEAIRALRPWLRLRQPTAPIFDPRRVVPSSTRRKGRRAARSCYSRHSLAHAIHRACDRAGIEHFTPGQLRHSRATALVEQFGLDVAQAVLGHARPTTTSHYAKQAITHAIEATRQAG